MDEYEMETYHKSLQDRIVSLEDECDRLEEELKDANDECDELEIECQKERAAKEEALKTLQVEVERHQKMMDDCMKANENAAKADARASSLVTSLEACEVQVATEQRARLEAEKRCTEMMDHIKALLSIQAKEEKVEPEKPKPLVKYNVKLKRDGNHDFREFELIPEVVN